MKRLLGLFAALSVLVLTAGTAQGSTAATTKSGTVITSVVAIPGVPGGWKITLSNGKVYKVFNGKVGLAGATGATGATGAKGDTGATGATGAAGLSAFDIATSKGYSGTVQDWLNDLVGPAGPQGDKGATGATGPQGEQGVKGDTGATAYDLWLGQGNTGTLPQFLTSLIGPKGDQGSQGLTGPIGPTGLTGGKGDTGPQGLKGDTGATGATGPQGNPGGPGPSGPQGPQGPQGPKGDTGNTGPQGNNGPIGPQGPAGVVPTYNYWGDPDPSMHAVFGGNTVSNVQVLGQNHQFQLYGSASYTNSGSYLCYGSLDDPTNGALYFTYEDGSHFTPHEVGPVQGFRFMCFGF